MLRIGLVCLFILSHVPAAHADDPKVIVDTHFVQLSSTLHIASQCGDHNANAKGCTQFVAEQLSARCVARGVGWAMNVKARCTAFVFLVDRTFRQHELLHIYDMEQNLSGYIAKLEEPTYPSAAICEEDAKSASSGIRPLMRQFAADSNAQRH